METKTRISLNICCLLSTITVSSLIGVFHLFEGGSELAVDSSSVLIGWFWLVSSEDDLGSSSSLTSTTSSFVEQGTISGSAGMITFCGHVSE